MNFKRLLGFSIIGGVILTLVILLSSFAGAASNQSSVNIGYVDMEKLQKELPDYQRFEAQLKDKESEFKLFQGYVLQQHRNSLKELQDKAEAEKKGKTAEEQTAIDNRYKDETQKKSDELNTKLEQKRNEIMQDLNKLKKDADEKVRKLINDVAAEKKFSLVLEKSSIYYGGTDITDAVIEKAKKEAATTDKDKKGK